MERKTLGLLAALTIVVGACSAATTSPAAPSPSASAPGSASPTPAASPTPLDFEQVLFGYDYKPEPGTPGGSIVISDWQAANQLNPVISTSLANSYVLAATMRGLFTVTADGHWKPDLAAKMPKFSDQSIRVDAEGKGFAMDLELKPGLLWSDGQPLTLNDLAYTWQWVLDPAQVGVTTTRLGLDRQGRRGARRAQGDGPLQGGVRRLLRPVRDVVPARALDEDDPDQGRPVEVVPAHARHRQERRRTARTSTRTPRRTRSSSSATTTGRPATIRLTSTRSRSSTTRTTRKGLIAAFLNGETDVALDLVETDYDGDQGRRPDGLAGADPRTGLAVRAPRPEPGGRRTRARAIRRSRTRVVRKAISQAIDETRCSGPSSPAGTPAAPRGLHQRRADELLADPRRRTSKCDPFDVDAANATLDAAGYMDADGDGVREMPNGELNRSSSSTAARR